MVDRGNVDKHRPGIPGGPKAVEESKWGARTAQERTADYRKGSVDVSPPMPDTHSVDWGSERSNMSTQGRGRDWADDVPENSWLRGGGKNAAEGKSNFDPRSKSGVPKKW